MSSKTPDTARPFEHHGVDLRPIGGEQLQGECPFCGKRDHFHVHAKTGQYDCKVCGASGNAITFLTRWAEVVHKGTTRDKFIELSKQRGIPTGILRDAGLGWDGSRWLLPSRSEKGTVRDIRTYDGKTLACTAGCKSQIAGLDELAENPEARVYLCEGEWDRLAMKWLLREAEVPLEQAVAVSVPGATVFKDEWCEHFRDREVFALYDADSAGDRGQVKAREQLDGVAKSILFAWWPRSAPEGYDTRDFVRDRLGRTTGQKALDELHSLMSPKTKQNVGDGSTKVKDPHAGKTPEENLPDAALKDIMDGFRACGFEFTHDLTVGLKIIMAVCLSSDVGGSPLWVHVVGPPSVGKTALLECLEDSRHCVFVSSLTPHVLVSGFNGNGSKDSSLIPKLKDKAFVAKDFTEILSMPKTDKDSIYSTLRGAYDGRVDKSYGNGVTRSYTDCRFSMVAGVTHAIHGHGMSSLGERFLKYRIEVPEGESRTRVEDRAFDEAIQGKKGDDARGKLKKLVAGYLKKRVDADHLRDKIKVPTAAKERIKSLARIVARLRTQIERDFRGEEMQYRPQAEFSPRLIQQLRRLATMLAHVEGKTVVDDDVIRIVERVAFDTAYGFHLDVVEAIMKCGGAATKKDVASVANLPASTAARRVDDLIILGVLEHSGKSTMGNAGGRPSTTYSVREEVALLWRRAKGEPEWEPKKQSDQQDRKGSEPSRSSSSSTARRRLVRSTTNTRTPTSRER